MESDLIYSLENVAYNGNMLDSSVFATALRAGPRNIDFKNLIFWLTNEINILGSIDEKISDTNDDDSFDIELSGFLKELMCPYINLTSGNLNERFLTIESRYLLLEYLLNELMTFKMVVASKPVDTSNVITINESRTAASLKDIAITLQLGKPPNSITIPDLFQRINVRLDQFINEVGKERIGKPLFIPSEKLSDASWMKLQKMQKDLDDEYDLRRHMLLTRLDVTIQSFKWSDKLKSKGNDITEKYASRRTLLDALKVGGENTDMAAFLASRDLLAIIEKTSSATVQKNTKSKIQRLIIGAVPDRGGRANEMAAPPPEMPSWQKRSSDRGGRGGGNFNRGNSGGGGGRGGYQNNNNSRNYNPSNSYNQGNSYNQSHSYNQGNSYNQPRSNNYQQQQQQQQQPQQPKGYQLPQDAYYQSQESYNQPQQQFYQQHDNNNRHANKRRGGRVQGGWSNREPYESSSHNYQQQGQQHADVNYQGYDNNNYRGGKRGRSNYNRGGGGGGGGRY